MSGTLLDTLRHRLGDRYGIDRQLGRGGMGAVFLGRDLQLGREVAIKVLPSEFATQPALRARFLSETRTTAGFSHPNIVPVFAVEERDDLVAMAMGYVEGESLAERVSRAGPLTIRECVRLLEDVGYALAYAHGRGVVHRDIKPDNIMLERATGRALVMDFGISRGIGSGGPGVRDGLTRVGEVVGTPEYMSPEQASGDTVDGRSDLYSLGLVAWFALTGATAMSGANSQQVLVRQLTETLPSLASVRGDVPAALADAVTQLLEKDPNARFATAEAFVEAVDTIRTGSADVPTPVRLVAQDFGSLGVITAGAMALAWLVWVYITRVRQWSAMDAVLEVAIVAAVLAARYFGTWQELSRLARLGFRADEIERGARQLVAEREAARAMLRADPSAVRRRRRWVLAAIAGLVAWWLLGLLARSMRTQIGPMQWEVPPLALALLLASSVLLGIALVVLLRSPLRMPLSERLYRLVWLGPIGRAFIRSAVRRGDATVDGSAGRVGGLRTPVVGTPGTPRSRSTSSVGAAASKPTGETSAVKALEARVASLERWRAEQEPSPTRSE